MLEKRMGGNDADAIYQLGMMYLNGDERFSIKKDIDKAVKLFHRAAELGSAEAHHSLAYVYDEGAGVNNDGTKVKQYYEKAAMMGCVSSRFNLGCIDAETGSFDRAIKHWLIAASGGDIHAVNYVQTAIAKGKATRDDYAQALRRYKQYVDEVRSDERDRVAAYSDQF
jgi:TPR repeat protein